MKTVTAIQTSDGRLFSDPQEARVHQSLIDSQEKIEAFMSTPDFPYISVPQKAIVRNAIARWELYKAKP